jgi:transglutaminase-like putative cysteine protease
MSDSSSARRDPPSRRTARSLHSSILTQLWQRLQHLPLPEPEDSLVLRVLVQSLVTVGIIATDVAAADAVDAIGISLWAVPLSIAGATWSGYRRRQRNVAVKFCIAIAMLVALAAFFGRLVAERNDTRIALAELLIQLQVFHSFDLPRRKDLGYSMVIGLILIGVAATLSQTLVFAPLLLLFLAIAIPVLILDYRSRLGLISQSFKRIGADLSLKRLAIVLLITLGLGLTIFALLPRFSGYQIRTFPLSSTIQFNGQFDRRAILNPGYVREGQGQGTATGTGSNVESGPGALDESFYYGFNTRINQNLRGQLQPKVVMRVRSQAKGFWRVLAFDHYTGQGWEVSRNSEEDVKLFDRSEWTFRFLLPWTTTLSKTKEVVQSYTIVSDAPNLIPALYEPKELYFPTQQMAIDLEGGLRSPVPLSEGLTYTVISEVPYRDRTQLRQAPNQYLPFIRDYYLDVPIAIKARVKQKTEEILAKAPNLLQAPYEQALYLAQYLKQNYAIQSDLPFLEAGEDLVEAFLFRDLGGYPDHFSTVLTVMLRSIGIPTRLVAGFQSGEFNPFTGLYIVRNTDAYVMTEVYFAKYGWFAFDPIPGHEVVPPSIEESQVFGVLRSFWNWIAGWLPSPLTGFLNGIFTWAGKTLAWAIAWITSLFFRGWVGLFIGLGTLTGLGFLGWLSWSGWKAWQYRLWLTKLPPMEALYQQMLNWLSLQGFGKSAAQTPLEYVQQAQQDQPSVRADLINEISQAYVQWRYGSQSPNIANLKRRLQQLKRYSFKRHRK